MKLKDPSVGRSVVVSCSHRRDVVVHVREENELSFPFLSGIRAA